MINRKQNIPGTGGFLIFLQNNKEKAALPGKIKRLCGIPLWKSGSDSPD